MLAHVNRGFGVGSSGKRSPAGRDRPGDSYDELGTLAVPWPVVATLDRPQLVSPRSAMMPPADAPNL